MYLDRFSLGVELHLHGQKALQSNPIVHKEAEEFKVRGQQNIPQDVGEIINYPRMSTIDHPNYKQVCKSELNFDSHLSGFVYKVSVHGELLVKKDTVGPDMIAGFLYEINALYSLQESRSVINLQGMVTDDAKTCTKGLLISFAERGALMDL